MDHRSALRHKLLRVLFWILIAVGFVFAIGVGVESVHYAQQRKIAAGFAREGYFVQRIVDGYRILPRRIAKMPEQQKQEAVRLFGSISKIEGNKITIINNAAEEQVVVSTAGTRIFSATAEVGIGAIKADSDAIFTGYMEKGQFEAQIIELQ